MSPKFPIGIPLHYAYTDLSELYLYAAMNFANEAALDINASKIFGETIKNVEPLDFAGIEEPSSFEELIDSIEKLPEVDLAGVVWQKALNLSRTHPLPVGRSELLYSVELAGHFVMLAAFVELSLNAYLETIVENGEIDKELWEAIERWDILQKSVFAFGPEIKSGKIRLAGLKRLQGLRNKFVHFKASNYGTHEITVAELLNIWADISLLLHATERALPKSEFDSFTLHFISQRVTSNNKSVVNYDS